MFYVQFSSSLSFIDLAIDSVLLFHFSLDNFLSRVPLCTETEDSRGCDARRFPLHCKGRRTWVEKTGRLTHGVLLNVEVSKFIFIITLSNLAEAPYGLTRSDFTEVNNENTEAIFMRGWHHCFSLVRLLFSGAAETTGK